VLAKELAPDWEDNTRRPPRGGDAIEYEEEGGAAEEDAAAAAAEEDIAAFAPVVAAVAGRLLSPAGARAGTVCSVFAWSRAVVEWARVSLSSSAFSRRAFTPPTPALAAAEEEAAAAGESNRVLLLPKAIERSRPCR
jgi:hypothetical protein